MDLDHLKKLVDASLDEETDGPAFDELQAYLEELRPLDAALVKWAETNAECDQLRAQLFAAEAANAATTETLVEHSALSGHINMVEQCRDWIEHEHIMEGGDTSGRLRDYVESLDVVVDQFDKQRRSRNWYAAAYHAGKLKLIEYATEQFREQLAAVMPADDEIDSVMSLLNWTRANHDEDSSARAWLERVVAAALRKAGQ